MRTAVRRLSLANDPNRTILVKMGKPQPLPEAPGHDHFCAFQINGLGSEKVKYAAGVDAFQSIELAFRAIETELALLNRSVQLYCRSRQQQSWLVHSIL